MLCWLSVFWKGRWWKTLEGKLVEHVAASRIRRETPCPANNCGFWSATDATVGHHCRTGGHEPLTFDWHRVGGSVVCSASSRRSIYYAFVAPSRAACEENREKRRGCVSTRWHFIWRKMKNNCWLYLALDSSESFLIRVNCTTR